MVGHFVGRHTKPGEVVGFDACYDSHDQVARAARDEKCIAMKQDESTRVDSQTTSTYPVRIV